MSSRELNEVLYNGIIEGFFEIKNNEILSTTKKKLLETRNKPRNFSCVAVDLFSPNELLVEIF